MQVKSSVDLPKLLEGNATSVINLRCVGVSHLPIQASLLALKCASRALKCTQLSLKLFDLFVIRTIPAIAS